MNQGTLIAILGVLALIPIAIISYGPVVVAFHKGRIKERRRIVELAYKNPVEFQIWLAKEKVLHSKALVRDLKLETEIENGSRK